jgi:hypothetical protein
MKNDEIKETDLHLTIDDVQNLSIEDMKSELREMEDLIIRQYIQMSSCWVCLRCCIFAAESSHQEKKNKDLSHETDVHN